MADRGRKAFPVSSHLCDERWQRHCMDLHKQRLADMKHRIDNTKPETFDIVLSKGKRQMLDKERQTEVDRENAILLQKMVRIKEQDTRAVFRPWTARSTFQWKAGHYYDPATNTKTLDHINLTSSVSPRSIHYFALTRPGTAPPDVTARLRDMQIQIDNTKLLKAITTMRSHYNVEEMERRHGEESILMNRISNFRGPEYARYQPPGRSSSASRGSPYLAPQPGRSSSSHRPPRAGWPASTVPPISQQRYYEEAQNRDIPFFSPRGTSRPGTAVGGTLEGLGDTSPRESGSYRQSQSQHSQHSQHSQSRNSSRQSSLHHQGSQTGEPLPPLGRSASGSAKGGSAAGSRPGSAPAGSTVGSRPTSARMHEQAEAGAAAGTSFSFGSRQEQERRQSAAASSSRSGSRAEDRRSSYSSQRSGSAGSATAGAADPGTSADDYGDEQYDQDDAEYDKEVDQEAEEERREEDEAEEPARSSSRSSSDRVGDREEAAEDSDAGYDDGGEAGEAEAAVEASSSRSGGGSGSGAEEREEEAERAGKEEYRDDGYGDGDGGAAASESGRGSERSGDGEAAPDADAEEGKASASEKKDDDYDGDAFDADPEADLQREMRAAEEAEMDQQFAAELAADGEDSGGVGGRGGGGIEAAGGGGDEASLGGKSSTASPQAGGFAADWD